MGEGSNFKYGEKSVAQQGTNMNSRSQHITTSSNDTQPSSFSFGIAGSSSHLTPNLIAGNSNAISSHKLEQSGMEVQKGENGQNKVEKSQASH